MSQRTVASSTSCIVLPRLREWQRRFPCSVAVVVQIKDRRHQRCAIDRMTCDHHSNSIDLSQTVRREDCFRLTAGHKCPVCEEDYTGSTEGSMIEVVQRHHHSHAVTLGEESEQG